MGLFGKPKRAVSLANAGAPVTTLTSATAMIKAKVRRNFAIPLLLGAARHTRSLCEVEKAHEGEAFGAFYEELSALATAAVMMCAASLEACVNELFADASKHFAPQMLPVWEIGSKDIDRKTLFEKSDWFLTLRGKAVLNAGAEPLQSVAALIELRNGLMHFKPEWTGEEKRNVAISRKLAGRFPPLPCLASEPNLFPLAWASGACAAWAVKSSMAFIDELAKAADLKSPVDQYRDRLSVA